MRNRRTLLLLAPVGAALVIALALVLLSQSSADDEPDPGAVATTPAAELPGVGPANDMLADIPSQGDTIGDPAAPVTIVEYGDLRCPVCKAYADEVVPTLVADLVRTGKARMRFAKWPILGPDSVAAAKAAYAAQAQDALWRYAHIWYANQGPETEEYATDEFVRSIAAAAGLDLERFDADRASAEADAAWQQVDRDARGLGLQGTPSIVVIGPGGEKVFDTVPEAADVAAAVDDLAS